MRSNQEEHDAWVIAEVADGAYVGPEHDDGTDITEYEWRQAVARALIEIALNP